MIAINHDTDYDSSTDSPNTSGSPKQPNRSISPTNPLKSIIELSTHGIGSYETGSRAIIFNGLESGKLLPDYGDVTLPPGISLPSGSDIRYQSLQPGARFRSDFEAQLRSLAAQSVEQAWSQRWYFQSREQFDENWDVLHRAYPDLGLPESWGDVAPLVSILDASNEILRQYRIELDRDGCIVRAFSRATDIVMAERGTALAIKTIAACVLLPIPVAGPILTAVATLLAEPIAKWLTKDP